MPWPRSTGCLTASIHDFASYFITGPANANPAVHYEISSHRPECFTHGLNSDPQYLATRAAPSRVKQGDGMVNWVQQEQGNAIRDRDQEEYPRAICNMAVGSIHDQPALDFGGMPNGCAMDLAPQHKAGEARRGRPKAPPPPLHLPGRVLAPEAKAEAAPAGVPAAGDPGHDSVPLAPAGQLEPGDRSWQGGFPRGVDSHGLGGPPRDRLFIVS